VWYWPTVVVLGADAVTCAFAVWAVRSGRRRRRGERPDPAAEDEAAVVQGTPKG